MEEIKREEYLSRVISKKHNNLIKIITGIRRCGKSYLLDPLFVNHLLENNIKRDHIIKIDLDSIENKKYTDPLALYEYVMSKVKDKNMYYILLDEIQKVEDFESVLNSFLRKDNLDVYVTGSNSKFLSKDIITEFRGRGDEIYVSPLSFNEFYTASNKDYSESYNEYSLHGGMPSVINIKDDKEKRKYLSDLFKNTYINDIVERNNIKREEGLENIISLIASQIGSLTNPLKIYNTFVSKGIKNISLNTIKSYLDFLEDAYLIHKVQRYDIKGKKYLASTSKYYFSDIGLRNTILNYRQIEQTHIMENIIYNELISRGFSVDIGIVNHIENTPDGKIRKQLEIDFICNEGNIRYYIQSAFSIPDKQKMSQEQKSLTKIPDFFKKIIIVKDDVKSWVNEEGIVILNLKEFLLNKDSLKF